MDTDFHNVRNLETNELYPCEKPIVIGKDVWVGMRSVILKGAEIADGCIIGSNSVINKKFKNPNMIIAGNPAAERKGNVARAYELEEWSKFD
jgi:acetyltransferase-like isoleucine patch superfamily enzyme